MTDSARRPEIAHRSSCGCCRRSFLGALGATAGGMTLPYASLASADDAAGAGPNAEPATVRAAFLYPPSEKLQAPGAWWSWPGNDFDAEGRQALHMRRLAEIEKKLGMRLVVEATPLYSPESVARLLADVRKTKPDGLLLIPFHNPSFRQLDRILAEVAPPADAAESDKASPVPTIVYSVLGVHHGSVKKYQRPGLAFLQTLDDDLEAVEQALRMVHTAWRMRHGRILSIAGQGEPAEATILPVGTRVRRLPLSRFVEAVDATEVTDAVRKLAQTYREGAKEILEPAEPEILTAARVHFACKQLIEAERADAIMIDCLRRGEYMPCMSFMTLRDQGIPAGCENDLAATLTLMLVEYLFDRPGSQANPCYDTEKNHFFASHCTSASKLLGPDGPQEPYLLRNYAHTNDPTCVPQVLWREGEPVTMAHYYPGDEPKLFVYTGEVVRWYEIPPVGGCRTNVAFTVNEHDDVCNVQGHHNVVFYGDHSHQLRRFAQLYGITVMT